MKNRFLHNPWLWSIGGGILLSLSWPPLPFFFLVFIALLPWIKLVHFAKNEHKSLGWLFLRIYIGVFIWNLLTTWWVWFASPEGSIAMFIANSLLLCIPFLAYFITLKNVQKNAAISLLFYFLAIEYFHFRWDAAYPWLTLGHVFAKFPIMVQWYEYTGVLGGTLWVVLINLSIYHVFIGKEKKLSLLLKTILPVVLSVVLYGIEYQKKTDGKPINTVIIQPNLDPYNAKFEKAPLEITMELMEQIDKNTDSNTHFVISPETAIPGSFEIQNWMNESKIMHFKSLCTKYPKTAFITGLETHEFYNTNTNSKPTLTARRTDDTTLFYDVYNTAGFFYNNVPPVFYHKSKLVPGVEKMPFPKTLGWLEDYAINLGGTSGSLGSSEKQIVFTGPDSISTFSLICYESIFGEFTTRFTNQEVDFISIITNDGWWGNTAGHHQHMNYARLRAIETGLWIARSANTGISCFIDPQGHIYQPQPWDTQAAIKMDIPAINEPSFYARHGDLLSKAVSVLAAMLFLTTLLSKRLWKK
jgi:apolipoprotein N-acyltransferase